MHSIVQSCSQDLTKGLKFKTKSLTPDLKTKTFRNWTQVLSRPDTLVWSTSQDCSNDQQKQLF